MKAGGFLNTMQKFAPFFRLKLSFLIFSATEHLSITLQGKNITVQEAVSASNVTKRFLDKQRTDRCFDIFFERVLSDSKDITSEPVLPRQRRPPRRLGGDSAHEFDDVKSFFRQQYFHALDVASQELTRRFDQNRGMNIAAVVEKILIDSCNQPSGSAVSIPKEMDVYDNNYVSLFSCRCFQIW